MTHLFLAVQGFNSENLWKKLNREKAVKKPWTDTKTTSATNFQIILKQPCFLIRIVRKILLPGGNFGAGGSSVLLIKKVPSGFIINSLGYHHIRLSRKTVQKNLAWKNFEPCYNTIGQNKWLVPVMFWTETLDWKVLQLRQASSMIHSARPTVSPVANIVFTKNLFHFQKWERTDGCTTCAQTMITTGRDCGSAEWINNSWKSLNVNSSNQALRKFI